MKIQQNVIYVVVDIESTGPIPNLYVEDALNACNVTFEQLKNSKIAVEPETGMIDFENWINQLKEKYSKKVVFVSDNLAFDWQWINYYFHYYIKRNPFGFSGRRIGDIYSGLSGDLRVASNWKKLRDTKHSHCALDDAMGNAEALMKIMKM